MYVPNLNFKTCCFVYWGGSHVVGISLLYLRFSLSLPQFHPSLGESPLPFFPLLPIPYPFRRLLQSLVSTHLCVVCCHFCSPMSALFQGHVTCLNYTLTGPLEKHHAAFICHAVVAFILPIATHMGIEILAFHPNTLSEMKICSFSPLSEAKRSIPVWPVSNVLLLLC